MPNQEGQDVSPFSYELVSRRGTVFITWAEGAAFSATASVSCRRGDDWVTLSLVDLAVRYAYEGDAYILGARSEEVGLDLTWCWERKGDDTAEVYLEVGNRGADLLLIEYLDVLSAEGDMPPSGQWRFYQNGWMSWTPSFARVSEGGLYVLPVMAAEMHSPHPVGSPSGLRSEWFTVFSAPNESLLLGFISAAHQLAEIWLDAQQHLVARCHLDSIPLPPGQTVRSETLLVRTGPDPVALLEGYANELGERMSARIGEGPPPTGWCSWYYFYGSDTSQDVLANLRAIGQRALDMEVIQIDDGYQTAIGDWLSVDPKRYPDGMETIADQIRAAGHRAGIWTAPFGAAQDSALLAEHPGWVVGGENRESIIAWMHMMSVPCYGLDLSRPDVLAWLEETFRTLRRWGYTYFKIDFLFAGAVTGVRHDPTVTRVQALRRGLEAIRRGVGEESYILACGAPLGPCVGLVDGMRVGPDVSQTWEPLWDDLSTPSVSNAIRNSVARAFMHNRLWHNDPDCIIVRSRRGQSRLVLNEMRTLVSVVALTGGLTLDSDHLPRLRGRVEYLRRVLPPTDQAARAVDLFRSENPAQLVLAVERPWGQWWVIGLLNWSDRTTTTRVSLDALGIPPGAYHVYNYWMNRYEGTTDRELVARRHQPHETRVYSLRPVSDEPDWLTSSFHMAQGAAEIAAVARQREGNLLRIRVDLVKPGEQFGDVLFTVPEGWRVAEAYVNRYRRHPTWRAKGVIGMGLTLNNLATVEIGFEARGQ